VLKDYKWQKSMLATLGVTQIELTDIFHRCEWTITHAQHYFPSMG